MNAIEFLVKEHNRVRDLLAEISDESHRYETKKEIFNKLCHDLLRHEKMEEEIWYPHFKHSEKLDDTVKHLIVEEKGAEKAIKVLNEVEEQEKWEEKFKKFKKDVEHHAAEEETKLFPIVKKILEESQLDEIGKQMRQFKSEYDS